MRSHCGPHEVGRRPRRAPRRPLESSNGRHHGPTPAYRVDSFTGEPAAAQLRQMMTTHLCVMTFFSRALTLNSPCCPMQSHGAAMSQRPSHTRPAASATLGDGRVRTAGAVCGFSGHALGRIAQIRRGCCSPPAWLLPLACGCCKPPLNRGSQQLPLLSCFRRCAAPPSSASSSPHRAADDAFAGRPEDPITSTAAHADERAERSCNASCPSACTNSRPRARLSAWICADQRLRASWRQCANRARIHLCENYSGGTRFARLK